MSIDLVASLSLAGRATERHVLDALRAAGFGDLRVPHGYVVQRLLVEPRTVTDLAADLGVTQQAVSKLAAELVAGGYAERADDAADARRRPLRLTARGEAAVAAARAARAALAAGLREAVGAADAEAAARVLRACLELLGESEAVAARRVRPVEP